jgi:peptide/nickel transport system substrate-binding protein
MAHDIGRRDLGLSVGAGLLGLAAGRAAQARTPRNALILGHLAELATLDPAACDSGSDFRILSNIYEPLVRFREGTLEVEPALATAWTISPDGKTYTFKLREGVSFHDGSAVDAAAIKFNFDRVTDKNHPYYGLGPYPLISVLGPIEGAEVVDPMTVAVHLSRPFAPMLNMCASFIGLAAGVSPAAVKQYGREFGRHGGGAGPFKLRQWEPNRQIVLEANPAYFRGAPKLAGLVFRPIVEETARISELLSGGIDMTVEVPAENVPALRSDPRFSLYEQTGPHLWYVMLNVRDKPFSDVRVRQAVNYAINKAAICDGVLNRTATVANGLTPPAFAGYHDDTIAPYPYDPARAKQLLAEAGYPEGVDVVFDVTQNGSGMLSPVIMGTAIQADLAAVGLRASIQSFEWNTYLARLNPGMGQMGLAEMSFMSSDPDTHPSLCLQTGASINSGYYSNPEVDRLLDAGRIETDIPKRQAIYKALQRIVHDDAPWAFIGNWKQNAVSASNVKGFQLQPSFLLRLDGAYKA